MSKRPPSSVVPSFNAENEERVAAHTHEARESFSPPSATVPVVPTASGGSLRNALRANGASESGEPTGSRLGSSETTGRARLSDNRNAGTNAATGGEAGAGLLKRRQQVTPAAIDQRDTAESSFAQIPQVTAVATNATAPSKRITESRNVVNGTDGANGTGNTSDTSDADRRATQTGPLEAAEQETVRSNTPRAFPEETGEATEQKAAKRTNTESAETEDVDSDGGQEEGDSDQIWWPLSGTAAPRPGKGQVPVATGKKPVRGVPKAGTLSNAATNNRDAAVPNASAQTHGQANRSFGNKVANPDDQKARSQPEGKNRQRWSLLN